ncbi:MAG: transglutaminase-like enzyme predicted cysteine protease [Chitinophagaceae bacterium]|nr:transglutaminase-like enzyme predicted cysteine protease [Chitinophagaceae bacterium]
MKNWIAIVLCCSFYSIYAQSPNELETYKKKHPNSYMVILKHVQEVTIDVINKDSLAISIHHYEEKIYTNKLTSSFSGQASLQYNSFNTIKDVDAYIVNTSDGKTKKTKVKSFFTKDVFDDAIFYDYKKEISFVYPSIEEGSKTFLEYNEIVNDPHFLGNFYFANYSPMEVSELVVKYSPSLEIDFKLFNADSVKIDYTLSTEKKYKVKKWTYRDGKEYKSSQDAQDPRYYLPHIIYYIKQYEFKGATTQVYSDVAQLYKWYYSMLSKMKLSDSNEMKPIVDSLVAGKTTEEEKVKAIYYWVQDNIKYIAFEDGMNGFVPEAGSSVCSNRYGDCKGMSNLLVEMLGLAGIKAYHTWVGSRDIPYKYKEVPTLYVDNHMIVAYPVGEQIYFLDATSKQLSFNYPSAFIQGKEALIGIDKDHYLLKEVMVVEAEKNYNIDTSYVSIEGNVLKGKGVAHIDGYLKYSIMNYLQNSSVDETQKYLEYFLQKGNNKFSLKKYDLKNLYSRDKELVINYEYEIKDYVNVNNNEYYVNMHLHKGLNDSKIEKDRENAFENSFTVHNLNVVILDLSDKYKVKYLPENVNFKGNGYVSEVVYTKKNNTVVLMQDYIRSHLVLEPSGFAQWNEMVKILKRSYNESIVFEKK